MSLITCAFHVVALIVVIYKIGEYEDMKREEFIVEQNRAEYCDQLVGTLEWWPEKCLGVRVPEPFGNDPTSSAFGPHTWFRQVFRWKNPNGTVRDGLGMIHDIRVVTNQLFERVAIVDDFLSVDLCQRLSLLFHLSKQEERARVRIVNENNTEYIPLSKSGFAWKLPLHQALLHPNSESLVSKSEVQLFLRKIRLFAIGDNTNTTNTTNSEDGTHEAVCTFRYYDSTESKTIGLGLHTDPNRYTVLIYLLSLCDDQGGETFFDVLNITITPKAGRLAVWQNTWPHNDTKTNIWMTHGGRPLFYGEKLLLQCSE